MQQNLFALRSPSVSEETRMAVTEFQRYRMVLVNYLEHFKSLQDWIYLREHLDPSFNIDDTAALFSFLLSKLKENQNDIFSDIFSIMKNSFKEIHEFESEILSLPSLSLIFINHLSQRAVDSLLKSPNELFFLQCVVELKSWNEERYFCLNRVLSSDNPLKFRALMSFSVKPDMIPLDQILRIDVDNSKLLIECLRFISFLFSECPAPDEVLSFLLDASDHPSYHVFLESFSSISRIFHSLTFQQKEKLFESNLIVLIIKTFQTVDSRVNSRILIDWINLLQEIQKDFPNYLLNESLIECFDDISLILPSEIRQSLIELSSLLFS